MKNKWKVPSRTGTVGEIPLLLSFRHLPGEAGRRAPGGFTLLESKPRGPWVPGATCLGTVAGGEFDWGRNHLLELMLPAGSLKVLG